MRDKRVKFHNLTIKKVAFSKKRPSFDFSIRTTKISKPVLVCHGSDVIRSLKFLFIGGVNSWVSSISMFIIMWLINVILATSNDRSGMYQKYYSAHIDLLTITFFLRLTQIIT